MATQNQIFKDDWKANRKDGESLKAFARRLGSRYSDAWLNAKKPSQSSLVRKEKRRAAVAVRAASAAARFAREEAAKAKKKADKAKKEGK